LGKDDAEQMQRIEVVGLLGQNLTVEGFGLLKLSSLMVPKAGLH
jgi:hypothetical protein